MLRSRIASHRATSSPDKSAPRVQAQNTETNREAELATKLSKLELKMQNLEENSISMLSKLNTMIEDSGRSPSTTKAVGSDAVNAKAAATIDTGSTHISDISTPEVNSTFCGIRNAKVKPSRPLNTGH